MKALYKTTIVIWSEYNAHEVELEHLAREATSGDAYCSTMRSEPIADPRGDPQWDGTEFFDHGDEDDEPREHSQPHCMVCGCDLHDEVCPEGHEQEET